MWISVGSRVASGTLDMISSAKTSSCGALILRVRNPPGRDAMSEIDPASSPRGMHTYRLSAFRHKSFPGTGSQPEALVTRTKKLSVDDFFPKNHRIQCASTNRAGLSTVVSLF
jgi:hypothetical protein